MSKEKVYLAVPMIVYLPLNARLVGEAERELSNNLNRDGVIAFLAEDYDSRVFLHDPESGQELSSHIGRVCPSVVNSY